MSVGIIHLEWDSNFFGKKVGKALLPDKMSMHDFKEICKKSSYDLVYAFSSVEQDSEWEEQLFDIKINSTLTYHHAALPSNPHIRSIVKEERPKELKTLVLQNGVHTRFYKDPKLKPFYADLYLKWLERCTQFDTRSTWYFEDEDKLLGFVTLANEPRFQVELCSVVEANRGQGIARKLWMHMFEETSKEAPAHFHISYQGLNEIGHQFYTSLGFKEEERFYIYHIWS